MTTRTLATQLVAVAVLKEMLAEADTDLRARLLAEVLPGAREPAAVDVDGKPVVVGAVTAKKADPGGQVTAAVTDLDALVKWCQQHVPDEVETIVTVRPAFQKVLLNMVKGLGGWPDRTTGELIDVDGIETSLTGPSSGGLMVTKTDDGPALIRAEIAAGRLTFADVLALPAGTP